MKDYLKPELEYVDFTTEVIADLDVSLGEDDGDL